MPGFTGTGLDFHDAIGDFGNFELEESLDQAGVCAAHHDLGAFGGLTDLDDVCL